MKISSEETHPFVFPVTVTVVGLLKGVIVTVEPVVELKTSAGVQV